MRRLFRWALASYWTWLVYLALCSPVMFLAIVLEHLWVLFTALCGGIHELYLAWRNELRPLWSSYADLWTRETHLKARSLGRWSVDWRRA